MSYLPCDLHCHIDDSVNVLLKSAKDDHLAFVALTDKNSKDCWNDVNDEVLPSVKGIEVGTDFGDVLAIGTKVDVNWDDPSTSFDKKLLEFRLGGAIGVSNVKLNNFNWANIDFLEIWSKGFTFENVENDKRFKLWTDLLDQGYRIGCSYGKGDENKDEHYGCTYLDVNGNICETSVVDAIKNGRLVASTGAKFFFRVHQKGDTYSIGDTLKRGLSIFSFFIDLHSREKNAGKENVEYNTIKVITNGGKCVMETDISQRHVRVDLKKKHWYRAELWGKVDGKSKILAVTSPIYTV